MIGNSTTMKLAIHYMAINGTLLDHVDRAWTACLSIATLYATRVIMATYGPVKWCVSKIVSTTLCSVSFDH